MVTQIIIPGIKDSQNRDPSLVLIELQGLLESDQPDLRGAHVGELEQDSKASGKVYLNIGHHKLEGKKAKLAKPLAVIAKRSPPVHQDTMDLDHPESLTYDVVRIIEEKFVFVSRPSLLVQEDLRGLMKV
ncbi:hypothetical protein INT43_002535 [Umbelopsis isabellina]|uniref:Ctf8 n=1 Tax=Mortierella isabellina TaxID=91625 RepID=A0A8H7ULF4_MORIS|nr:hypothetical protein INT43_002535 [Umbelopsis isabellina]